MVRGAALAALLMLAPAMAQADDALSPPPLTLSLAPEAGGGSWRLKIENTGDVPVRVAADPRLLVLDITAPAGTVLDTPKKGVRPSTSLSVTCKLPDDSRPANDEGSGLVIPGKRSWTVPIDPLFYCFGPRERHALVAGAVVTAHFGWPVVTTKGKPKAPAGPSVAMPVGAAVGKLATAKELVAAPITLTNAVATAASPANETPSTMAVTMAETKDVARGTEIESSVTVTNEGDQTAVFLFRPETVRFSVAGPQGSQTCGGNVSVDSPIRELYGSVGAKHKASLSLLLDQVCPVDTFDEPGIYRVTATLDTTQASGRRIGLRTWDGESTAKAPLLLRVRLPRRPTPPKRPSLD